MKKEHVVITVKADNRPGLLHLVPGLLERKLIRIESLSLAPTDIHEIVLITIEVFMHEADVTPLVRKLENIIEVFEVEAVHYDQTACLRAATKGAQTGHCSPR